MWELYLYIQVSFRIGVKEWFESDHSPSYIPWLIIPNSSQTKHSHEYYTSDKINPLVLFLQFQKNDANLRHILEKSHRLAYTGYVQNTPST